MATRFWLTYLFALLGSQLLRRLAGTVVAPARRSENIAQCRPDGLGPADVLPNGDPLVEGNADGVMRVDVRGEAVRWALPFRLERAEEPIPDDKNARVVFVEIIQVGPVMDAVVGRRIKNKLNRGRKLVDVFGMNPELI